MANLVRSTLFKQCLRQLMQRNQAKRNVSVLVGYKFELNSSNNQLLIKKDDVLNSSNNQLKRNKSFLTKKILYSRDELAEKILAISKKHEKIDESKLSPVFGFMIKRGYAHKPPIAYDNARDRIMLVLKLFDKIDPDKLTLESNFMTDLGLDSLDHVEIIMAIEDEFFLEILDVDAEKLLRPIDILQYLEKHEECYKELQHSYDMGMPPPEKA